MHVAGSKGKGTVCRLIGDYLKLTNKKVGVFMSPHLLDVRERIVVNGQMVAADLFESEAVFLNHFLNKLDVQLTYFEFLFLIALKVFEKAGLEFVVLEVGLGGRLDATNIIFPEVACITRIEKEHTAILGDSYREILGEKLGICKTGVPVVSISQNEKVACLMSEMLDGRELYVVGNNEAVARKALEILDLKIDEILWTEMLRQFDFLGRFTMREIDGKTVVLDIAHTAESVDLLRHRLIERFPDKSFVILFSCLRDKNLSLMAEKLKSMSADFVFCSCHDLRGFSPGELKAGFNCGEMSTGIEEGFDLAFSKLKKDQVLVVTGSNFLVAEVLKNFF